VEFGEYNEIENKNFKIHNLILYLTGSAKRNLSGHIEKITGLFS